MNSTESVVRDHRARAAGGPRAILLGDTCGGMLRVTAHSRRPWDALLVRVRATTLDRELVAGRPADGNRLRSLRAEYLIAPPARHALARHWLDLLGRADGSRRPTRAQLPIRRAQITATRDPIERLAGALCRPQPAAARGVALAGLLLTDGTGPVYSARSKSDLGRAVETAIEALDPVAEVCPLA